MYDEDDEDLQLAAISENAFSIRYIQNPTEKVQLKAVEEMVDSIKYVINPSKKVIEYVNALYDYHYNRNSLYPVPKNVTPNLEFSFYEPVYTSMEQIMFHLNCYINEKVKFFKYKSLKAAMNFLSNRKSWCFENGSRACSIDIRKLNITNLDNDMIYLLSERHDKPGCIKKYKEFAHGSEIDSNYLLSLLCGVEFCPDGHADYLVFEYEDEYYIITILCYE